jgi:hypothetical protein
MAAKTTGPCRNCPYSYAIQGQFGIGCLIQNNIFPRRYLHFASSQAIPPVKLDARQKIQPRSVLWLKRR